MTTVCLHFFKIAAVISELFHPEELAIARLSEAFGPTPAKFIDFKRDDNGASSRSVAFLTFLASFLALALL